MSKNLLLIIMLVITLSAFSCTQSSNLEVTCDVNDLECLKAGTK